MGSRVGWLASGTAGGAARSAAHRAILAVLPHRIALITSLHSPWSHKHMVTLHCVSHFLLFLRASQTSGHGTGGGGRGGGDGGGGEGRGG